MTLVVHCCMCFCELLKMLICVCDHSWTVCCSRKSLGKVELELCLIAVHAVFREGAGTVGGGFVLRLGGPSIVSLRKIFPVFFKNLEFRVQGCEFPPLLFG